MFNNMFLKVLNKDKYRMKYLKLLNNNTSCIFNQINYNSFTLIKRNSSSFENNINNNENENIIENNNKNELERDTIELDLTDATKYLMDSNPFNTSLCAEFSNNMKSQGYFVHDNLLGDNILKELRKEVEYLAKNNIMQKSYTVQYDKHDRQQIVYNEHVLSLEPDGTEWNIAQGILMFINRIVTKLSSGLCEFEPFNDMSLSDNVYGSKLEISATGDAQPKHVDNPGLPDTRKLTLVYFMNPNWKSKHGGHYRLYNGNTDNEFIKIEPIADRLLAFWSDLQVHKIDKIKTSSRLPPTKTKDNNLIENENQNDNNTNNDNNSINNEMHDCSDLQSTLTIWLVSQQAKTITPQSHPLYQTLRAHFPLSYR